MMQTMVGNNLKPEDSLKSRKEPIPSCHISEILALPYAWDLPQGWNRDRKCVVDT